MNRDEIKLKLQGIKDAWGHALAAWITEARYEKQGEDLVVVLELAVPVEGPIMEDLRAEAERCLERGVIFEQQITQHVVANEVTALPGVKNMVLVGSAKGGVGKSTVTYWLAQALSAQGARVGILDADIYGPNIPALSETAGQEPEVEQQRLIPVEKNGVVMISMAHLVTGKASMWRGPMASKAIKQLATSTQWPPLDYLLVDLPPGTGDIQITLMQQLPVVSYLLITTAQDLALEDAHRLVLMMQQFKIPASGVVENMASFQCGHCSTEHRLFGAMDFHEWITDRSIPWHHPLPFVQDQTSEFKSLPEHVQEVLHGLAHRFAASIASGKQNSLSGIAVAVQ